MVLLVEYFCRRMWWTLTPRDEAGLVTAASIRALFDEMDADGDGEISLAELLATLQAKLGDGASRVVAEQMLHAGARPSPGARQGEGARPTGVDGASDADAASVPPRSPSDKMTEAQLLRVVALGQKSRAARRPTWLVQSPGALRSSMTALLAPTLSPAPVHRSLSSLSSRRQTVSSRQLFAHVPRARSITAELEAASGEETPQLNGLRCA